MGRQTQPSGREDPLDVHDCSGAHQTQKALSGLEGCARNQRITRGIGKFHVSIKVWKTTSTAFRKFVLSSDRFFGRRNLRYRKQSVAQFPRPFGKESSHANPLCSTHHFRSKCPCRSASVNPSAFHPAIVDVP